MKSVIALFALALSVPAFASHPHDRVCVGETKIAGGNTVSMVFQWESGRAYDTGSPNTDSHEISFEASSCWGDYMDSDCTKSSMPTATYKSPIAKTVPAVLKTKDGKVFFQGTFTFASETLKGQIDSNGDGTGKLTPATVKLSCVGQPRLTLDESDKDLQ